jgi:hypothetical protein
VKSNRQNNQVREEKGKGLLDTNEEYLQKPVVPNLLLGKVREILER